MRFETITAASLHLLGPLKLVERPASWPTLEFPANDAQYFAAGEFGFRTSWTLYVQNLDPRPGDVFQRDLGECWLAALLKAVAARQKPAITDNLVRLNSTQYVFHTIVPLNDTVYVPINVPVDASVTAVEYKKSLDIKTSDQGEAIVWPNVIEKAIAKVIIEYCIPFKLPCAPGTVTTGQTLNVLDGNQPATFLTMLTGADYSFVSPDDLSDADISDIGKMAEDRPVVISTTPVNICSMTRSHALWLAGLDSEGRLIVHNPWKERNESYTVTEFRRQVSSLSVPAVYRTREGLYPPLRRSLGLNRKLCNGAWFYEILVWTLLGLFASPFLLIGTICVFPVKTRELILKIAIVAGLLGFISTFVNCFEMYWIDVFHRLMHGSLITRSVSLLLLFNAIMGTLAAGLWCAYFLIFANLDTQERRKEAIQVAPHRRSKRRRSALE